jgi:hypothetical protein
MEPLPVLMEAVSQVPILTMNITDQPTHRKDIPVTNVIELDTVHETLELLAMKTAVNEALLPREDIHRAC